jgi:hypothetical protein
MRMCRTARPYFFADLLAALTCDFAAATAFEIVG